MKKFIIPEYYKSNLIQNIKKFRKEQDKRKKDFSPTLLDFGTVQFLISRHFGFCYGVENAIEIAYNTIEKNPNKKIYLLSEMIHNPGVNNDLLERGVRFIMNTSGEQIIPWNKISSNDIVLIPAFGTTIEIENKLATIGLEIYKYNTTCPFVEKVWNRASQLAASNYTIIIHGKHTHEETRATFSHSTKSGNSIIVKDISEAKKLAQFILEDNFDDEYKSLFADKTSKGFEPDKHLTKVGVVNQTTMLASETEEISNIIKLAIAQKYGDENLTSHFADTRDTLCYATNDNQNATLELLNYNADMAFVVGGYNSSNTSHIVELLGEKFDTFFISSENEIISNNKIYHYNLLKSERVLTNNFLPQKDVTKIIVTSGASCPDSVVESVIEKLLSFFPQSKKLKEVYSQFVI